MKNYYPTIFTLNLVANEKEIFEISQWSNDELPNRADITAKKDKDDVASDLSKKSDVEMQVVHTKEISPNGEEEILQEEELLNLDDVEENILDQIIDTPDISSTSEKVHDESGQQSITQENDGDGTVLARERFRRNY